MGGRVRVVVSGGIPEGGLLLPSGAGDWVD